MQYVEIIVGPSHHGSLLPEQEYVQRSQYKLQHTRTKVGEVFQSYEQLTPVNKTYVLRENATRDFKWSCLDVGVLRVFRSTTGLVG